MTTALKLADSRQYSDVHMRLSKYYPPLLTKPLSELTDKEKIERINLFKKYIELRSTHHSTAPLYDNADDLQLMIDDYFANGVKEKKMIVGSGSNTKETIVKYPTISGMILHIGYCDIQSFYNLESDKTYAKTVKKARLRIIEHYESSLFSSQVSGPIFALKNVAGWRDKSEQVIDQTIKQVNLTVKDQDTASKLSAI